MSYIGNQPTSVAFLTDQFSGTGSQTAFTLSAAPANTASIIVAVSGVLQDPTTYSVSGLTLTFSAAPPSGTGNISVRFLGIPASNIATTAYRTLTEFTATAGQTTFTVPSYTVGYINVLRNGVQLGTADFTATNGTTVVLATGATAGDLITTESFYVSSVLNAIPATAGAVTTPYILDGAVTAAKMASGGAWAPAGTVLQVVSAIKTDTASFTSTTFTDVTGLSVSITPRSATSKFLVMANVNVSWSNGIAKIGGRLMRNSTAIAVGAAAGNRIPATGFAYWAVTGDTAIPLSMTYLDSPATTSTITYKWQANNLDGNDVVYVNRSYSDGDVYYFARVPSTITVLEIAG